MNKQELLNIDARFKWLKINDKNILSIDASNAKFEEMIAIVHRFSYYGSNIPVGGDPKPRLIANVENSEINMKLIRVVLAHTKVKTYFVKHVAYGTKSAIWISLSHFMAPFVKSKPLMFKTKEEALNYASE